MKNFIYIVDSGGWSVSQMISEYDHLLKKAGKNDIRFVFVDYIGIVKPDRSFASMVKLERVEQIVEAIKEKAKRTNSVWVVLSQLTRRPPQDKSQPNSSWFKESSTIEETAGQAIILRREKLEDGTQSKIIEFHCVKNRYGQQGMLSVRIHPETGLISKL